ncbi:unnamed protein product [Colias eurytheme]|nr:unnamed protein product [Colias eurytheme]
MVFKMVAISKDLYCVIQFQDRLPDANTDFLVCVRYGWIKNKPDSDYVTYPVEDNNVTEVRVIKNEKAKRNWNTYKVFVLRITPTYDEAQKFIAKRLSLLKENCQVFQTKERKETKKRASKGDSKPVFKKPKINPAKPKKKVSLDKSITSDDECLQDLIYSGEEDEVELADKFTQTVCISQADKGTDTPAELQQPDTSNKTQNQRSIGTSTDFQLSQPQINVTRTHDVNLTRLNAYAMTEAHYSENLQFPYGTLNPTLNPQGQNYLQQAPFSRGPEGFNIFINGIDVRANPNINVNVIPTRPFYGVNQGPRVQYQNYWPQDTRFQNSFPPPIFYSYPQSYGYNQRSGEQIQRDARNSSHIMETQTNSNQEQMQTNVGNTSHVQQETYSNHSGQQIPSNDTNESIYVDMDSSST